MRIAQVSPLYERVPPVRYGGTERVVSFLTEALVDLGHDVTLFATGDSITRARLCAAAPAALRTDPAVHDGLPYHCLQLALVVAQASEFDVIHFHTDYLHFPTSRLAGYRHVTTLHGRLDLPDLVPLVSEFGDMPLVSISDAQRQPLANARWTRTVPHGLPMDLLPFSASSDGSLAFVGRISPEKRLDLAIDIARHAGRQLRIGAKIDRSDEAYFNAVIAPLLSQPHVEFWGEIDERQKAEILGRAGALLFPIDWPEPFGLVMIEAMACGTPVVAFRRGSVPEIITPGVTGAIVDTVEAAAAVLPDVLALDRAAVRRTFEERFSAARMANDYLEVYASL